MTADEATVLLNAIVQAQRPEAGLSDIQVMVFQQVWLGRSYSVIARESGYQYDYIKQVGSQLWRLLSQVLGQDVSKSNIRTVLQQNVRQVLAQQRVNNPHDRHPTVYQNLPAREFHMLVGRRAEISRLLDLLTSKHAARISIEGMGGMGKTALAIAVAYHFLDQDSIQAATFGAILFTSAKSHYLTANEELPRLSLERSLREIFRAIAYALKCPDVLLKDFDEQLEQIQERLSRQHTLLIVDNLETIEDYSQVLAFLYDLPATVKVVITSRRQTPFTPLRLNPLSESESIDLIGQQAEEKGNRLTPTEAHQLYQRTSGIPAAIVYAVGQLAAGYPLREIPNRLTLANSQYAHFYFTSSVRSLQSDLSHHLLMALALFPRPAVVAAIAFVAGSPSLEAATEGLARLQQRSLISQQQGRYDMLALTREYAIAELVAHLDFQQAAQERWVEWYLSFAQEHGSKDEQEWQDYGALEQEWENLRDVIEWCIAQNRYDYVQKFWSEVRSYSYVQGYRGDRLSYWSTRLDWTDWLIQAAEQQQDWSTALEVLFERGWTLTLMGQSKHLEAADRLFDKAWRHRSYKDLPFQINLAIHIAVLRIQQQEFDQATQWLWQAEGWLQDSLETPNQRLWIHLRYYQGEIAYKTEAYGQAKLHFQQVLDDAQASGWQRAIFLAKDWLANIALKQGSLEEAQILLKEGLQIAEANQDDCRAAFCMRSIASLEKARHNWLVARYWADSARQNFERLGMMTEAQETRQLLKSLE